ncbi:hemoglobin [Deinococcus reticulitermitis]|uniref:Hemoglobin n=1 Tax=Deinococcus reticulitermitis TaxID=856736 RepID=A0A1H7BI29_9DEIO|nr:hemoglobin [Deinococcus reticulitermitis]
MGDWETHLDRVTAFWITLLGGVEPGGPGLWRGDLGAAHTGLGLRRAHLERWLELFGEAAQAHLTPAAAEGLTARARRMGERLRPAARRS